MKNTSTIRLSNQTFSVRLGIGVFEEIEARFNLSLSEMFQSGQMRYMIAFLHAGINLAARKSGQKPLSLDELHDLLDETPDWMDQLSGLTQKSMPAKTEDAGNPNPPAVLTAIE